ncbi:uncharacterized protein LOC121997773 [Zingiber officinale]|uniref:Uncharacterized protein n=1 Tax=Zingiber officinale TaxID=94328 RepID=A0A8J5L1G7_ZINOF|nr:uncharacterized protein LOC121997773 [Zingiber officinale]KAG6501237.1 hypothetical protein ZIOFF_041115 [Zingiber officinale]
MEMTSASRSGGAAKRLWHIVRLLFLGFSKNKLMVDLHLLLKRGKIAGKALTQLLIHHHHDHYHHRSHRHQYHGGGGAASMYSALTCRSMDPDLAFYNPREVQFSCSNTPSYPTFRRHRRRHHRYDDDEDDAAFAKALETLYAEADIEEEEEDYSASAAESPAIWKSPSAPVRQLRVTDSPFPLKEEEGEVDGRIDQKSEEFIKKFHEQLRLQQMISPVPVVAPEYMHHRRRRDVPLMMGRA